MIKEISHPLSPGLHDEIAAQKKNQAHGSLTELFAHIREIDDYCRDFMALPDGLELLQHLDQSGAGQKILEIGPGSGQLALDLARRGYRMSLAEPSPELCEIIDYLAGAFSLPMTIYRCAAEYIDRIDDAFDIVIFNSSLHHCDDPVKALQNCHRLLKPGGRIIAANEPILPFFRSQGGFYRRLRSNPGSLGHYGGNEHIYHYSGYINMLDKSGFSHVYTPLNVRYRDRRLALAQVRQRGFYNRQRVWARQIWFWLVERMVRGGGVGRILLAGLKQLSLLTVTFLAEK